MTHVSGTEWKDSDGNPDWDAFAQEVEQLNAELEYPTSIRQLRAQHQFASDVFGDGYTEPRETWEGCSCGVTYDEWQQHAPCSDDCACNREPVDIPTAHANHLLGVALRARLVQTGPLTQQIEKLQELNDLLARELQKSAFRALDILRSGI